jgi:poly(A) polymerase
MNIILKNKNLSELLDIVDGYVVGGAVRDYLLGKPIKDYDVATHFTPERVSDIVKNYGWSVYPSGLSHGTVTVKRGVDSFEVTTFRKDVDSDGRHATIEFAKTPEEDSRRRDFTINALYMDRNGAILDFHGGLQHLVNGKLRFVGEAKKRIEEDALRILRYFRFKAQNPDLKYASEDLCVINENVHLVDTLSRERIWSEFSKILVGVDFFKVLNLIKECNLLNRIVDCSGVDLPTFRRSGADPIVRLHLLAGRSNSSRTLKTLFALSNNDEKRLSDLATFNPVDIRQMLYRYGIQFVIDSHMAQGREVYFEGEEMPIVPVRGQDLIDMGFKPGKSLGEVLKKLENMWLDSNLTLTREELLKHAV